MGWNACISDVCLCVCQQKYSNNSQCTLMEYPVISTRMGPAAAAICFRHSRHVAWWTAGVRPSIRSSTDPNTNPRKNILHLVHPASIVFFFFMCTVCTDPGRINDAVTTCVVKSLQTNSLGRYKTKSTGPHSSQNSPATADQYIYVYREKQKTNQKDLVVEQAGRPSPCWN